jgi:DNA phosphorothioation-dependent restriction protein DptG
MLCSVCNINQATKDKNLGYLPCKICQDRFSKFKKPSSQVEFTSDNIKEGRKQYFKSIIQPWREGVPSKEYQDAYPEQSKKMFAKYKKSEIREVWNDISPIGGIGRTK